MLPVWKYKDLKSDIEIVIPVLEMNTYCTSSEECFLA